MVSDEPGLGAEASRGGVLGILSLLPEDGLVRSVVAQGTREVGRRLGELEDARVRIEKLESQVRVLNIMILKIARHVSFPGARPEPSAGPGPASPAAEPPGTSSWVPESRPGLPETPAGPAGFKGDNGSA